VTYLAFATAALMLLLAACNPYYLSLPKLAQEDATVMVRCSDSEEHGSQLIVILLDHTKNMTAEEQHNKRRVQKIAEIEVDSSCRFTVRAPKTPIELTTQP
jgi:hypothetical protein